jgi:hypothetical protein
MSLCCHWQMLHYFFKFKGWEKPKILHTTEHLMIYRGLGFLAVVFFGSSPFPLSSQQVVSFLSVPECRRSSLLTERGGGVGEKPNHTTTRKPGPL